MKSLLVLALVALARPAAGQAAITPSQTRLIGCFGEAFTIVEHVWRIAPAHLEYLAAQADRRAADSATAATGPQAREAAEARRQFLSGVVASGLRVDQASALAVVRNLDGCMTEATATTTPDATTAVLAAALRTELDSAIEDVAELISGAAAKRSALQSAVRSTPGDHALDSPLDAYLAFGATIKEELVKLRTRADALIAASTPR